ncbi:MAG: hypothetical protein IPH68_10620 [Chitinophagaceae bacterium]|nr:hypothetical protein [Chitinophagaceae bacterium]MBK7557056.1 hypothetical protein [Chitinophagaceae bacterium]MBK9532459.1 hypothetical protein [Chitinophagaceae bacterium]HQW93662.1 hypothetical protein [Ferruginibacter sp.]
MIKCIFTAVIFLGMIISCNSGATKSSESGKAGSDNPESGKEKNMNLVYLDTAENMYNILCQGWVMEDDADALEGMDENSKFEIPYRSFYFSTEGSFVKNPRNAMDYGKWSFDASTKTITINNTIEREINKYTIALLSADEMILVNTGINSTTNLKFISPGRRFKNAADDPFFLENNRWRIKPKAKEPDSLIHQRLKDNIHFFILFYKRALAMDDKVISFWGLPSCFKWYGGGVFLKKETELKENWINCYYNKEQAMQAYALADKLLSQKYNWPKGEQNWLKLNLAVLEQMYKKLDDIH